MPNVRKEPEPESGMKRAADFQEGFMGVPGYSDDSLLSVVRYISQVQMTLRKCDFEEFMEELKNIENATKAPAETPAARIEKIKEHRAKAMAKIAEFPELTVGFETFMTNSKRLRRQQNEAAKDSSSSGAQ